MARCSVVADGLDLIGLDFNLEAAMQGLIRLIALVVAVLVARQSSEAWGAASVHARMPAVPRLSSR